MVKMGRKSVFHPHDAHILDRFTVLYIIFLGFQKYLISAQIPKGLAKRLLQRKWTKNSYFISVRSIFYSIRHYGVVHIFEVLKNIEFGLKNQRGYPSLWFYQQTSIRDKN
jgi:hypothetical protein